MSAFTMEELRLLISASECPVSVRLRVLEMAFLLGSIEQSEKNLARLDMAMEEKLT